MSFLNRLKYFTLVLIVINLHFTLSNKVESQYENNSLNLEKLNFLGRRLQNTSEVQEILNANQNYTLNPRDPAALPEVTLTLGNPGQSVKLVIDTTSTLSWVYSSDFVNSINSHNTNSTNKIILPNNESIYNASNSRTSNSTNHTINEEGLNGEIIYDTISIGDKTVDNFGFVALTNTKSFNNQFIFPKLGLGFKSERSNFSLLDLLKSNNLINKKLFAISQKDSSDNSKRLYLGESDNVFSLSSSAYSFCNLTWTEDLNDEYRDGWVCDLTHLFINSAKNFSEAYEVKGRVTFDTTYDYISAPNNFLSYFIKNYFNTSECRDVTSNTTISETVFVCNGNATVLNTPLSFVLDGYAYKLDGKSLFEKSKFNQNEFESKIRFRKENDNIWTLGLPFINNFFTVFNAEDEHVGFYGGDKTGFVREWTEWNDSYGNFMFKNKDKVFYLILGASVLGAILFILLVFIVVHSIKRRRLEEHGPLINEHERN